MEVADLMIMVTMSLAPSQKINNNQPITANIGKLDFAYSGSDLTPQGVSDLKKLAQFLKNNPSAKLTLTGGYAPGGGLEKNQQLAKKRAKVVQNQLLTMGVQSSKIVISSQTRQFKVASVGYKIEGGTPAVQPNKSQQKLTNNNQIFIDNSQGVPSRFGLNYQDKNNPIYINAAVSRVLWESLKYMPAETAQQYGKLLTDPTTYVGIAALMGITAALGLIPEPALSKAALAAFYGSLGIASFAVGLHEASQVIERVGLANNDQDIDKLAKQFAAIMGPTTVNALIAVAGVVKVPKIHAWMKSLPNGINLPGWVKGLNFSNIKFPNIKVPTIKVPKFTNPFKKQTGPTAPTTRTTTGPTTAPQPGTTTGPTTAPQPGTTTGTIVTPVRKGHQSPDPTRTIVTPAGKGHQSADPNRTIVTPAGQGHKSQEKNRNIVSPHDKIHKS
ncbi:MAG: OmpA family protein, partial [Burkholderiales bacterium]